MQGSMFVIVAAVLILLLLLIWMNILMVRRGKNKVKQDNGALHEASSHETVAHAASAHTDDNVETDASTKDTPGTLPTTAGADSSTVAKQNKESDAPNGGGNGGEEDTVSRRRGRGHHAQDAARETATTVPSPEDKPAQRENESHDVEVVASHYRQRQGQGKKMFDRSPLPYFLHGASVPEFDSSEWHDVFLRLSGDVNVMGWVAFHNDTAGASDREYEHSFLDVLRMYKRSVTNLQREVGLSHVLETSVVGEEGKIWFLSGNQDHWFALFVDRKADVHEIAKPFMSLLLSNE
ncbi:hypothetical protein JZ785_01210 [Alicyclobacillus curvatus]|nr:hypothetical protein JZ785_01210 [Alicyclobacillus curvatus]